MNKDPRHSPEYWNQRKKKSPLLFFLLLATACLLLAYIVSRAAT